MTHGDDKSRRTRGSDGRLYDSRKQADRGHRAHENRAQTAARRLKWFAAGLLMQLLLVPKFIVLAVVNGLKRFCRPRNLLTSLKRFPDDVAKLPAFTKAVFRNSFRPVTSRVSRDGSSQSNGYSRRRD